jgi:hypothetical protein
MEQVGTDDEGLLGEWRQGWRPDLYLAVCAPMRQAASQGARQRSATADRDRSTASSRGSVRSSRLAHGPKSHMLDPAVAAAAALSTLTDGSPAVTLLAMSRSTAAQPVLAGEIGRPAGAAPTWSVMSSRGWIGSALVPDLYRAALPAAAATRPDPAGATPVVQRPGTQPGPWSPPASVCAAVPAGPDDRRPPGNRLGPRRWRC